MKVLFQDISHAKDALYSLGISSILGGSILLLVVLLIVTLSLASKTWGSNDSRLIALLVVVFCVVFVVSPIVGDAVQYVVHRTIPTRYFTYNQIAVEGDVYTFSNRFSQRSVTVKKKDIAHVVITYEQVPDRRWPGQHVRYTSWKYFAWVEFTNGRKISTPAARGYFPSPERLSDTFRQVGLSDIVQINLQSRGPRSQSDEQLFSLGSLTYHNIDKLTFIIFLTTAIAVWLRTR